MILATDEKNNRRGIGVGAEGASLEGKYIGVLVLWVVIKVGMTSHFSPNTQCVLLREYH